MSPFREVAFLPPQSQNRHSADFARGTRKTKGAKAAPWVNCDFFTACTRTRARMLMLGSLDRRVKAHFEKSRFYRPKVRIAKSADIARGTRKMKGAKAAPGVNCDRSTARTCTRARMLMLGSLERSWKVACVKKSAEEN